jgi:hypothetical protein
MKLLRTSASLSALICISLLAACGGGGGSGGGGTIGTPPTQNPGPSNPPATNPPPTPTPSPTPTPVSTSVPVSTSTITVYDGGQGKPHVTGVDNWQTNGVTTSDKGDGDTSTGGQGPLGGGTIDGTYNCTIGVEPGSAPPTYHVHAFLGILVNGTHYAVPDGIGMFNPQNADPIFTFGCAYNMHVHDASDIIHVEDPNISGNWDTNPVTPPPAKYNLQGFMDIWGQSLSTLPIAGVSGLPTIYVGLPTARVNGDDVVGAYTQYTGSPSNLLLQHHVAIWLVYGTFPAAGLDKVDFGISN